MRLFDCHNHLQDDRLAPWIDEIVGSLPRSGVILAVVNGSCEEDWESVAALARQHSWIKPSFGLHPWYVKDRSRQWKDRLMRYFDLFPSAAVGEIGIDRWIENPDIETQEEVFQCQLDLAFDRDLPVTIHCLRAWGVLDTMLRSRRLPSKGFLLHSYGGPAEMVPGFAQLGAYFSMSPYFAHERKAKQAGTFAQVPADRLLAESDAPDMWPPDQMNPLPLATLDGQPLNHPGNVLLSYVHLAKLRNVTVEELAAQIEHNFVRLFGPIPR